MSIIYWRCVSCSVISFLLIFLDIRTGATLEGSSMGYLTLPDGPEPSASPAVIRVPDLKAPHQNHSLVTRRRRNVLFPSGVKLCAQETAEQVVGHHLSFFHLRVCQETIWEAFKIFWDRLPEQDEYQSWMSQCQDSAVTAHQIGSFFSQSDEHQALVKKRMSQPGVKITPTPETTEATEVPEIEKGGGMEDAAVTVEQLDNDIAMEPVFPSVLEQVLELSILLTGEIYSDNLDDPSSLQFQTLSRQLAEKIEDALEGLPGFKSVSVLDFRPQKDSQGLDGVVVDYAVTVVVDGAGVSNEQLDYLTLQSNRVENSYRTLAVRPTAVHATDSFATEELKTTEPQSVSDAPESVTSENGPVLDGDEGLILDQDADVVHKDDIMPELTESNTVGTEEDITVLEDNAVLSPMPDLPAGAPESGSFVEEDLLLEDIVQTPAVENPPPEEVPAEDPSTELPDVVTLPEPPVEVEASGSGELEEHLKPAAPTELDVSFEHIEPHDGLITGDEAIKADAILETEKAEVEVTTMVEEAVIQTVDEQLMHGKEVPEESEITTTASTTTYEEVLPANVLPPEAVDLTKEASEPTSETASAAGDKSSDEDSNILAAAPTDMVDNAEQNAEEPGEETNVHVVSINPDIPVLEEDGLEAAAESDGQEVIEETLPEAPAVETEGSESRQILTEDLAEDEILLVNRDETEPPVLDVVSHAQPTVLSPERESPFTRISEINAVTEEHPHINIPSLVEIQTTGEGLDDATIGDQSFDLMDDGFGLVNHTEEGSTGFPTGVAQGTDLVSLAMPLNPRRALMVFFSLRVTNMMFSDDLFNKSSAEYKALEQRFLELLVPYLQSNLTHFENLEILNFRNGSIVVNSRMKFGKPVKEGVTTTVYLILEDFCNTAYQTMNLAIDKYSLDVESGDQADPCKFQACNEYAECKVNKWSGEAECVCNAGYFSVDGLPCQSICDLRTDFCLNDGKCDIIAGQGAICRCRVGENWWYRGEHCEEYVSEPLVVGIAIASVAGFLLVASGVIFFLARTLRDQYDKEESEDPIRHIESLPSLERATKYNPMYESEATTGYSHYYRRYPEVPMFSSTSAEASTDFSSDEMRHIYEHSELTKEEIQDRIRILELYAKDRQFASFVRQHQAALDTCRDNSST
ncbi:interphotoreceptor matrix proteoglycan 2 isoform X2 [Takifugu flavidus]|nr:interphotoreceptor matrix proteoglycan 2 isoform X2 [Takifugu flavidus]